MAASHAFTLGAHLSGRILLSDSEDPMTPLSFSS